MWYILLTCTHHTGIQHTFRPILVVVAIIPLVTDHVRGQVHLLAAVLTVRCVNHLQCSSVVWWTVVVCSG